MKTSDRLIIGKVYTRIELIEMFGIKDATVKNGIFRPKGRDSVWLFVTEDKTADRTQYRDRLVGNDLYFEGQTQGRTDNLIIDSAKLGLELLLFQRKDRWEYDGAGFRYEGSFEYVSNTGRKPRRFHLKRSTPVLELTASTEQIKSAIWQFNSGATANQDLALDLLRSTEYWVWDPDEQMFGPSKFVGFAQMNFENYQQARDRVLTGRRFDGYDSRTKVEQVIGTSFRPDLNQSAELVRWGEELLDSGCFDGVDRTKWRFLTVGSTAQVPKKALTQTEQELESVERELSMMDQMDARRQTIVRKEQGILRRLLFGSKQVGKCCICGREFPVELLVVAHIKRRADCSRAEKRDRNNVVPMCKFGCDDLFERGYIFINAKGSVIERNGFALTAAVKAYLSSLENKKCESWSGKNREYFRWHAVQYGASD